MRFGCRFTDHQVTLTQRHIKYKIDFVEQMLNHIHVFYQNYFRSILGFAHSYVEISLEVSPRVKLTG